MALMIAGQVYAESWQFTARLPGPVNVPIVVPDATYYVLGDATADDLLHALNLACAAIPVNISFALVAGHVRITIGAGVDFALDFTADLRFALGWRTDVSLGLTQSAPYRPSVTYTDASFAVQDLERPEALVSRALTDERAYTSAYGTRPFRAVELYFSGRPRSSDPAEEFYALRTLFDVVLSQGRQFRYYPDTSASVLPYLPLLPATRPYGYQVYTHDSPAQFAPAPRVADWYEHWAWSATWLEEDEQL